MPNTLRAVLTLVFISVLSFLGMAGWYWSQFKQDQFHQQTQIEKILPALRRSLQDPHLAELNALIDKIPYAVVLTQGNGNVITSNLNPKSQKLRNLEGLILLRQDKGLSFVRVPPMRLYFQTYDDVWDPHLLFPLFLSLLLGLIYALREYLQSGKIDELEDALQALKDYHGEILAPEDALYELRNKVKNLETLLSEREMHLNQTTGKYDEAARQLKHLRQQIENHQIYGTNQVDKDAQLRKLEKQVKQQLGTIDFLKDMDIHFQSQKTELRDKIKGLREKLSASQNENQSLLEEKERLLAKNHRLEADIAEKDQILSQIQGRMLEMEQTAQEVYSLYQQLVSLRIERDRLLLNQEGWEQEREKLIALLNTKDAELEAQQIALEKAIQRIRKLASAYKKQVELVHHLPPEVEESIEGFRRLIQAKDKIEKRNLELQVELRDRQSEIHRLHQELGSRRDHIERVENRLEELEGGYQKLLRELELLSDTLLDKLNDLERFQQLFHHDAHAMRELIQERDRYKHLLAELQDDYSTLEANKNRLLFEKESLAEKLEAVDAYPLQIKIAQLQQSVEMLKGQVKHHTESQKQLEIDLNLAQEKYRQAKHYADSKGPEIQRLHEEIDRLKSMVKLMEKKLANHHI